MYCIWTHTTRSLHTHYTYLHTHYIFSPHTHCTFSPHTLHVFSPPPPTHKRSTWMIMGAKSALFERISFVVSDTEGVAMDEVTRALTPVSDLLSWAIGGGSLVVLAQVCVLGEYVCGGEGAGGMVVGVPGVGSDTPPPPHTQYTHVQYTHTHNTHMYNTQHSTHIHTPHTSHTHRTHHTYTGVWFQHDPCAPHWWYWWCHCSISQPKLLSQYCVWHQPGTCVCRGECVYMRLCVYWSVDVGVYWSVCVGECVYWCMGGGRRVCVLVHGWG